MGPRPMSRGTRRRSGASSPRATSPSFNGAAADEPRNADLEAALGAGQLLASMGPRPMSRGTRGRGHRDYRGGWRFNGAAADEPRNAGSQPTRRQILIVLQWGRGR